MRAVSLGALVFAATVYFSILGMVDSKALWMCTPCDPSVSDCDIEPAELCLWGETRNSCGRRVCAKGPGQRCGGPHEVLGKCGAGMWCQKEDETLTSVCHGCYDNSFDCHQSRRYF